MELTSSHRIALAATLAGAGAIHVAMVPVHADDARLHVAFAAVAAVQLVLALAIAGRAHRRAVHAAVAVSAAAIVAWAASRATGHEPVGAVDLAAVGLEVATVAFGCIRLAMPSLLLRSAPLLASVVAIGAVVSPAAATHGHGHDAEVVSAAHEHAADPVAEGAHDDGHVHEGEPEPPLHEHDEPVTAPATAHATTTSTHTHAAVAPVAAPPDVKAPHQHVAPVVTTGEHHAHGPCTAPVTAEQQAAADELVVATRATLAGLVDLAVAEAAGFVPITPAGAPLVHYGNPSFYADGAVLDPARPESIIYAFPKKGPAIVVGAMFLMESDRPGPQVGGCLTQWHLHDDLCLSDADGTMVAVAGAGGACPAGSAVRVTPEMLHVWGIDLPSGPFSETNPVELRDALVAGERVT